MAESVESAENAPLFFNSEYEFGIDAKRRLQIPAKWKNPGLSRFTLLLWRENAKHGAYLYALPPEVMKDRMQKFREKPLSNRSAETVLRHLGANSADVILDGASRICLPKKLAAAAGLKKRAVLVGMWDRFQIWDLERYEKVRRLDEDLCDDAIRDFEF